MPLFLWMLGEESLHSHLVELPSSALKAKDSNFCSAVAGLPL